MIRSSGLRVLRAPSLASLTTLRLGGQALALVLIEHEGALSALPDLLKVLGGRAAVLGRGSNILAADGELPLVLLAFSPSFQQREGLRILDEDEATVRAAIPASLPLPLTLENLAKLGLGGLSGLVGIPGTLGGAVAMNAGSFGREIKDQLLGVRVFFPSLGLLTLPASELELGYRSFTFKDPALRALDWNLIIEAEFRLPRATPGEIRLHMRECLARKRVSQPLALPSAGCVFKNPPHDAAGRLLEEAGYKGRAVGGMAFSSLHANFMVNTGRGTAQEAFTLLHEAREAVRSIHGISLETEVKIWA